MTVQGPLVIRVMVLGVRGIPNIQGGIETHAEHLYGRLANLGCDVEIIVRSRFVPAGLDHVGPIKIRRLWSPRTSGLEALVHSLLGVLYAGVRRPDILHIHAIGPSIVTPVARVFGLNVVVTHHGPDYDRDKWGRLARSVLHAGEWAGVRYSHARIAISNVIVDLVKSKYGRESVLIPNGVLPAKVRRETDHLERFGPTPGRYVLNVSRLVPEKRQLDLIRAFTTAKIAGWKLVLVGGLDSSDYCRRVQTAAHDADVVLTDFQRGEALAQIYSHAGVFVLPSSHEGLPIAMLEALSYGLPTLASSIPANLEIGLSPDVYFPLGDVVALANRISMAAGSVGDNAEKHARVRFVAVRYDWSLVAEQTLRVYRRVLGWA